MTCLCDGAAYEVKPSPFLIHPDCPVHGVRVDSSRVALLALAVDVRRYLRLVRAGLAEAVGDVMVDRLSHRLHHAGYREARDIVTCYGVLLREWGKVEQKRLVSR